MQHPQRNASLDLTRVIAILAVVMLHVCTGFVQNCEVGSPEFIWGNILDSLSRIGVPLFIMTSGALLLDEEKEFTIQSFFRKRLTNLILCLFFWSAIYAIQYEIVPHLLRGEPMSIKSLIWRLIYGHYHLWFLYMLLGLYLTLPFLRAIVCRKNSQLVLLYLGISLIAQFSLPVIQAVSQYFDAAQYLITLIDRFRLGFFNMQITYFLLGWYIVHVGIPERKNRIALYCAAIASLAAIMVYVNYTKDYTNAYADEGLPVLLYASGVFLAINSGSRRHGCSRFLLSLSKCSFGIYVVHIAVLDEIVRLLPRTMTAPIHILSRWLLVISVSLAITWLLSRIPLLRRFVRM